VLTDRHSTFARKSRASADPESRLRRIGDGGSLCLFVNIAFKPAHRRFAPRWRIETPGGYMRGCRPGATPAKLITRDEARRMAANFAKLLPNSRGRSGAG
jgi:hypothetical protein